MTVGRGVSCFSSHQVARMRKTHSYRVPHFRSRAEGFGHGVGGSHWNLTWPRAGGKLLLPPFAPKWGHTTQSPIKPHSGASGGNKMVYGFLCFIQSVHNSIGFWVIRLTDFKKPRLTSYWWPAKSKHKYLFILFSIQEVWLSCSSIILNNAKELTHHILSFHLMFDFHQKTKNETKY
jgi:hypothetical protein